jgi:hypothetical protein
MRLEDLYDYDPLTGVFTYKVNRARMKAGSVAGSLSNKYNQLSLGPRKILAHRAAWYFTYGYWPDQQLDHIDGNPQNNAIANLEMVTPRENVCRGTDRHKRSQLPRGVTMVRGRYKATVTYGQRTVHLGYYDTAELAHNAYLEAI